MSRDPQRSDDGEGSPAPVDFNGSAPQRERRFSVRKWARRHRLAVAVVWLLACAWLTWQLIQGPQVHGDLAGLVPPEHRAPDDEILVMLTAEETDGEAAASSHGALIASAERVHERVEDWVPIAPPRAEVQGWLDEHALLLLPVSAHDALQQRLTNDAIEAAVDGLRARASSPFFGVARDDARRDPLQLRTLTDEAAGRFGHVIAGTPQGAEITARGDLVSAEGDAVLMLFRRDDPIEHITQQIRDAVADTPVRVEVVGAARQQQDAASLVAQQWPRLFATALAAVTIVLALALRQVRPALATVAAIATLGAAMMVLLPSIDPLSVPLVIVACAMAFEGAPHVQRVSPSGWTAAAILSTALLPLWWTPYPLWKDWAWWWALAMVAGFVVCRVVAPALMGMLGGSSVLRRRGFMLRPAPILAALAAVLTVSFGVFSADDVGYRGPDRIELGSAVEPPAQQRLRRSFFDPSHLVWTTTRAEDETEALVLGAEVARRLGTLVPEHASRVDTPAALVLPPDEIAQRRAALERLDLRSRLLELENTLQARGFRPAAFGEFLRGASDTQAMPTPESLLQGPLGRWTQRYLEPIDDDVLLRSYVHLHGNEHTPLPVLTTAQGQVLELRGPSAAARTDHRRFADWLLVAVLGQLWLGGLFAWLGARSLAVAVAAMLCAVVTQTAVLAAMVGLGEPLSPVLLPALLLVGATAMIASARACRAADAASPLFAVGLLSTSAAQVAVGLTLIASGVPAWSRIGWVVAVGCAVASGVGLFVAPGITAALRRLAPRKRSVPPVPSGHDPGEGDRR